MDRLFTPWRRAYLEADQPSSGCFLCDKPQEPDDRAALILLRAPHVYVLLNLFPYNTGHVLVVPYTHNGDLGGLQAEVAAELMHVTQQVVRALQAAYRPDALNAGMNLGKVAGAGVPDHLHMHVVPRWSGDTNFMPVLAQTKVLPETLDQTYDRLAPYFAAEPRHAGLDL